jgi:hypothetical protein
VGKFRKILKKTCDPDISEDTEFKYYELANGLEVYHVPPKIMYVKIFGKYE